MNPLPRLIHHRSIARGRQIQWLSHFAAALLAGLLFPMMASGEPTDVTIIGAEVIVGAAPATLEFELTRGGDLGFDAFIDFQTTDGTALDGTDYTATAGRALIPAGAAGATIPVAVLANTEAGDDLTLQMLLDGAAGVGPAPDFTAAAIFPADTNPALIAAGDFNGDGRPDLVVANQNGNNVSVLLNNAAPGAATASFAATVNFGAGNFPQGVAVGDLNGDGRPDLLVANFASDNVSVLLNTTTAGALTPSFATAVVFGVGDGPVFVAVDDFNGDGRPDLVTANGNGDSVSVRFNTTAPGASSPSFAMAINFNVGNTPRAVAAGDLNGDGRPDLAVANLLSNQVSVLLNTTSPGGSTASFTAATDFVVGNGPFAIALGDLDGDGRPDLAVANQTSSNVSVLRNTTPPGAATPGFSAAASFALGNLMQPRSVALSDLNGDGRPDLAVANSLGDSISVLRNATVPGSGVPDFAAAVIFANADGPRSIAVSDFNGDGRPDLAVTNFGSSSVSVRLNTATPGAAVLDFAPAADFGAGSAPVSVAVGDLNGDHRSDLVVANFGGNVSVLLNATVPGETVASFAASAAFGAGNTPRSVALADFNGDGRPDVAVANLLDDNVSVLLNTTTAGALTPSFATAVVFGAGDGPIFVAVDDLNGDGRPDLVVANLDSNDVSVLLNTTVPGATTASFAAAVGLSAGSSPASVALDDVNGDGRPDLLVANNLSDNVSVLLNTTTAGAASPSFAAAVVFGVGNGPIFLAVDDLNGDGRPDLVVANSDSNDVSVLLNTTVPGATTPGFAMATDFFVGLNPNPVVLDDLDGDGRPDLVVGNLDNDNVSVLLNTTVPGAMTPGFAAATNFVTGDGPFSIAVGDLDSDGRPDLAVANALSTTVSVLLNTQYRVTLAGSPATGTLVNNNAPVLAIDPVSLDFGPIETGATSAAMQVTLQNTGSAAINIGSVGTPGAPFIAAGGTCGAIPFAIAPASSCTLGFSFSPVATGVFNGTISVTSDAPTSPDSFDLTGEGVQAAVTLDVNVLDFGLVSPGTSGTGTVSVTNSGTADLVIGGLTDPAAPFTITGGSCTPPPVIVAPAASCDIVVEFAPLAPAAFSSSFNIESNAASSPDTVTLLGTGGAGQEPALAVPVLSRWGLALLSAALLLFGWPGLGSMRREW